MKAHTATGFVPPFRETSTSPLFPEFQSNILSSINKRNQFTRRLLVLAVGITVLFDQQALLHPDPVDNDRDQDDHNRKTVQARVVNWYANNGNENPQVDRVPRVSVDAMRDEPVIFPDHQGRMVRPPQRNHSDNSDCQSNHKQPQPEYVLPGERILLTGLIGQLQERAQQTPWSNYKADHQPSGKNQECRERKIEYVFPYCAAHNF